MHGDSQVVGWRIARCVARQELLRCCAQRPSGAEALDICTCSLQAILSVKLCCSMRSSWKDLTSSISVATQMDTVACEACAIAAIAHSTAHAL